MMKVLMLCLITLASRVQGRSERGLADVAQLSTGELEADGSQNSMYQPVSTTTGALQSVTPVNNWTTTFLYATIETSTNASYSYSYTSKNGTSRFNVTATLTRTSGSSSPGQIVARIQTQTCGQATLTSNYLKDNSSNPLNPLQISSAISPLINTGGRNLTNSTVYQLLVDYSTAASVALYDASGNVIACRNLDSPFPDLPNDWSATVEISNVVKGRTTAFLQSYSQKFGKIRLDVHGYGDNRILITDAVESSFTSINPQNGSCSSRPTRRTNWQTGPDNITLLSTSEALHFQKSDFKYVPGTVAVRDIQCERWQANVTLNNSWANASFIAVYYFPVNQWLVSREDYHRLPKLATLNGTWSGAPFQQTISYINFRPRTFQTATFDICAISPYGSNCNCTDARRRAAFANITSLEDNNSDDFSVNGNTQTACKYGAKVPHGFIRAQSGPYVGLTIIGMIGGGLITGLAMYFFYRKRVGVTISDTLGHQKFTDAPQ